MKLKERLKRKYYILITFLISLFLFIIIFSLYSKKLNPKLNDYIDFLVKDEIYKKVIKSNNFITNEEVNDILYIDKNKSNEIVYLDYDIDKTYKLLNKYAKQPITTELERAGITMTTGFSRISKDAVKVINYKKESVLKTEILISSKIINGKVPTFYGKNIFKESGVSTSN